MLKHHQKLFRVAATAAAAAAITATGAATASAAPHAHPAASGTEHFQIMSTSATSNTSSIIGTGVFTAGGSNTDTSRTTATVTFPNGTFIITHSKGTGTQSFNPKTCLLKVNLKGTYSLGSGTGAYTHLSGSGNYQLSILEVAGRSGGRCSMNVSPLTYEQVILASGPISLS